MVPDAAILDANVLYPAPLRDILLQLSVAGLYRARWSAEIDQEWKRNLIAARPHLAAQIERTNAMMHRAVPEASVLGHAGLIPDLTLPDPDDRHVLAAAIIAEAGVIVTYNLRDFPPEILTHFGIEAQHPDAFLMALESRDPMTFEASIRACLSRLTRPPLTITAYLSNLRAIGLMQTAALLDGKLL